MEAIVAGLKDRFRVSRKFGVLIIGIPSAMVTALIANNLEMIKFLDGIASTISLPMIALAECIIFGWLIGADKIRISCNVKAKIKLNVLFDVCLKFVAPAILLLLISLGSRFITSVEIKILLLILLISVFVVVVRKVRKFKKYIKLPVIKI